MLEDQQVLRSSRGVIICIAALLTAQLRFISEDGVQVLSKESRQHFRELASDDGEGSLGDGAHNIQTIHHFSQSFDLILQVVLIGLLFHLLL